MVLNYALLLLHNLQARALEMDAHKAKIKTLFASIRILFCTVVLRLNA